MATFKNSNSAHPIEIGILEIRRHVPVLYTFGKICKTKNTNVTIFTTKEVFSRLETYLKDKNNYEFVIKEGNESICRFLKRVETICNKKIDLLFVNTIHETIFDLLYYLSFNPRSKTVLVVHHANAWLKPKLVLNIKHMLRTIDTNLSSVLISKFIFPKFDAIDVIYSPVRDHILINMEYDKEIFTLPTSIFEGKIDTLKQKDDKILKVVIPGLIQEHRKDFTLVIPAFENLFKRFKEKLALCVLGMPVGRYGKLIHEEFKEMEKKGYKVVVFDSFVPDDTFDEILNESDIILTPIRIKTRADSDIEEEYGKTVGSGIVYNAIQYAKPIIVPAEFNMLKEFDGSALKYENSKELETLIDELIFNPEKLKKLKVESLKNAQKFSLKNLQDYFEKNVLSWLQKN
ncbi:MAG: hypothetical protein KAJ44_01155 [Thermoplasmatales archaeon]|nr:hypothetical protein [Thermoplasmatales archaeon]